MAFTNQNFENLTPSYLFSDVAKRVANFKKENPDKNVIKLGIGDVTLPLCPAIINALHGAVDEMSQKETFKGYGPEQGYDFLKNAIIENEYTARGIKVESDEIFVSDGSKSDTGNIGDIFGTNNIVAITDPVYTVYLDTNIMAGRTVKLIPCTKENGFAPAPPDFKADIIYLCSPNNPTGSVMSKELLKKWVDYALANQSVIFFDAAYEAFITDPDVPHSIYEIEGAKKCAIEFRSFSKNAGFTGTRCAYTVIPNALMGTNAKGESVSINKLWNRRHTTKFNGTPYITQKGAAAIYTKEGKVQVKKQIASYLKNAKLISDTLKSLGFTVFGGENSPYVWFECPDKMSSWEFFDYLLNNLNVVGTPGSGFGKNGEGYFRLTGFGDPNETVEAMERFRKAFAK